jgi:hypothetical protein
LLEGQLRVILFHFEEDNVKKAFSARIASLQHIPTILESRRHPVRK